MSTLAVTERLEEAVLITKHLLAEAIDQQIEDSPEKTICEMILDSLIPPLARNAPMAIRAEALRKFRDIADLLTGPHDPRTLIPLYALIGCQLLLESGVKEPGNPAITLYSRLMFVL